MLTRNADPPEQSTEQRDISIADPGVIALFNGGGPSLAGVSVNETSALGLSAVFRAVSLIAGGIATLPLRTVQDRDGITERVPSWLDNPAGGLTRFELIETTLLHLLLNGNTFWAHIYGGAGQLVGVSPIHPHAVGIDVDKAGTKSYRVSLQDGTTRLFNDATMTHIKGLSTDGIRGLSPLQLARNGAFGTAIAADRSAARLFGNGALMSAIVTPEDDMSPEDADTITNTLSRRMGGEANAGEIAVINRKLKISPFSLSNEDAQWIQSREFQVADIARMYGVPSSLIGLEQKNSSWGTGNAEMHRGMATFTFKPWTTRIEARLSLLLPPNRKAEFDYRGLLAPDPATEIKLLLDQVAGGLLTNSEARAILNRAPLPQQETNDD